METQNLFPFDALPPRLFDAVMAVGNTTKAPYEMVASLALSVGAECCQGGFDVEMPQFGSVPLGVNLCVIAESGLGKTQVLKALRKPVRDFENKLRERFKAAAEEAKVRTEAWETIKAQIHKSIRKATERGRDTAPLETRLLHHEREKLPVFPMPNLSYSDATPVALKMGLAKWSNAALVTDEGSSFFDGRMSRDWGFLNQIWDGSSITLDRADSTVSCKIEEPRLTLVLAVQPRAFEAYVAKAGEKLRDIGATARFLFCKPPNNLGLRFRNQWEGDYSGGLVGFYQRCHELLAESVHESSPAKGKKLLRLDSMACPRFIDHSNYIESGQQQFCWLNQASDHASKVTRNTLKVAAILHLYGDQPESDISLWTLDAAIRISEFFTREFLALFVGPPEVPQFVKDANELWVWMQNYATQTNSRYLITADMQSFCPSRLRKPSVFKVALNNLCMRGVIKGYVTQNVGYYDLNPLYPTDWAALNFALQSRRSLRRKSATQGMDYPAGTLVALVPAS